MRDGQARTKDEPVETRDAIVIGAGPAGCAAATVLAEKGHRAVLLERERFPRYRVGESLIPHCWFPLNRLGLTEKLDASGFIVHKHSVQFIGLDGEVSKPFYFFQHREHPSSRTWQVVRSEFDQMLLDNALEKGVELLQETTARELLREDGAVVGVHAETRKGPLFELRAPVTIDASGRDTFAQIKSGWRVPDAKLKKYALWTYYREALRDSGLDAGATTIAYLPEKGWFWYLPLADDLVSVGIVGEKSYLYRDTKDPEEIFLREVQVQPWIRRHLEPGTPSGEFQVTSDFSYRSKHCATDGLILTGDAFAFLDPVFSSGVFLALQGGVMAGDAVHEALRARDVSGARFTEYGERFCHGIEAMRRLVHAFYDPTFSFGTFFKAHPDMRAGVTDVLIGDLYQDFEPLFEAMSTFADIPTPLPHGGPLSPG